MLRAAALLHRPVGEVAAALGVHVPKDLRRQKGLIGHIAELALGSDPKAGDGPDFPDLGIELKTVPVDPAGVPVASTFVCSIQMSQADREVWESSRLRRRLLQVLWLPVYTAATPAERRFGAARLWRATPDELALLAADWEDLIGAIGAGRPPDGHAGHLLQVRPKAATREQRSLAPANDGVAMALPLGFYLRRQAVLAILAHGDLRAADPRVEFQPRLP